MVVAAVAVAGKRELYAAGVLGALDTAALSTKSAVQISLNLTLSEMVHVVWLCSGGWQ